MKNITSSPAQLETDSRFFSFEDNQGRRAQLDSWCCPSDGRLLSPGENREVRLYFKTVSGWQGKETSPTEIFFRVTGLKPLIRGTWSLHPPKTLAAFFHAHQMVMYSAAL